MGDYSEQFHHAGKLNQSVTRRQCGNMGDYSEESITISRSQLAKLLKPIDHEPPHQCRLEEPLSKLMDPEPRPVPGQPDGDYLAPRRMEAGLDPSFRSYGSYTSKKIPRTRREPFCNNRIV